MLKHFIHTREKAFTRRETNRIVRPFEWGTSFVVEQVNDGEPRDIFRQHTQSVMRRSDDFYALPPVKDYQLDGDLLTWTSAVQTPSLKNNKARARFFPAPQGKKKAHDARRAVVLLPQWNADAASHVNLCRLLNRLGISALRMTLPYHDERRPPELERADYLVSSNVGRTIQSIRQAVLDARAAVSWLIEHRGFDRVGIMGTSIGSCVGFLALAHDARIGVGVFNHVSGYFADVVWRGLSTRHVRAGFGNEVTLDELREYWLPISPLPFAGRLRHTAPRPMRFIAARYDLTFLPDLSQDVITEVKRLGLPIDVAWLRCGHYSLGENPWKYVDGWKIVSFFRKHL